MVKFMTAREAADLIKDGDTLVTEGFVVNCHPESLCAALEERFLETGTPAGLTLLFSAGQGDGKDAALNHLGHEKLLKRVIGGHWNLSPKLGQLSSDNKIEAYNLPQGAIAQLYREIASGRPGLITHVGLKTFVDPRLDGGKINDVTTEDVVELIEIAGQEKLFYKSMPINVCFLRGTTADEKGNISMEKEGLYLGAAVIAQATKNSGGKVVVQVERKVKGGSIDPRLVKIPGIYVDAVVVVPPAENMFEANPELAPAYCGDVRLPADSLPPIPLDARKVIARRAAMELTPGAVVNLGIGIPEMVSAVAGEEGIGDQMTLTVEAGPVGGFPANGLAFGLSMNPEVILDQATQFDFYDGGGLDLAYLGLAECDPEGNINVSKLGKRVTGCGGFINITQNAKRLFYCGTFTAKGLKLEVGGGKLTITQEGQSKKFVEKVGHVTFSGKYAAEIGQPVLYITERAVFELRADGLHLTEVAPGVDIQKDVLDQMDFIPKMDVPPKLMDARIFTDQPMGLDKQ
ncbi:acyl CoA:acetate/3-ketoacid CoA transferase [Desulfocurvus sp. DL9XJH121]